MMKLSTTSVRAIRFATKSATSQSVLPLSVRYFASPTGLGTTATPKPKRRSVTPFNDTGFVPWNELSGAEKAARMTQQSYNFGMVIFGVICTGGVGYFLWTDVFSPESKTNQFSRAVDMIKKDHRCLELLGDANKISAHGDETINKWRMSRPITSTEKTDTQGNQHLVMHFYVEGPLANGVVQCHMVMPRGQSEYEYKYLFLDIKGHERIYLENADTATARSGKKPLTLFGVKWG